MFCSLCKRIFLMKQHVWYTLFGFLFLAAAVFADEVKITGLSREAVVKNEPSRAVMGYLNTSIPIFSATPEPSVFHAAVPLNRGGASPFRSTGSATSISSSTDGGSRICPDGLSPPSKPTGESAPPSPMRRMSTKSISKPAGSIFRRTTGRWANSTACLTRR